jgi:hypothetical protein
MALIERKWIQSEPRQNLSSFAPQSKVEVFSKEEREKAKEFGHILSTPHYCLALRPDKNDDLVLTALAPFLIRNFILNSVFIFILWKKNLPLERK